MWWVERNIIENIFKGVSQNLPINWQFTETDLNLNNDKKLRHTIAFKNLESTVKVISEDKNLNIFFGQRCKINNIFLPIILSLIKILKI